MSPFTGLVVDGPPRIRGTVYTAKHRDLRYLEQGRTADGVDVVGSALLTSEELRVGNRVFRVWLEVTGRPGEADVTRGILALIDADPAVVRQVEVR